ncbi:MAG: mechanosensitive ion channel family protein, partial [Ralstonia sp.]
TNRTIKEALAEAGFPAPTPSQALTITTPGQLAGLAAVAQSTTTPTSVN